MGGAPLRLPHHPGIPLAIGGHRLIEARKRGEPGPRSGAIGAGQGPIFRDGRRRGQEGPLQQRGLNPQEIPVAGGRGGFAGIAGPGGIEPEHRRLLPFEAFPQPLPLLPGKHHRGQHDVEALGRNRHGGIQKVLQQEVLPMNAIQFSLGKNVQDASARLFDGLRQFDDQPNVKAIVTQAFPAHDLGGAYMNRLNKSAGGMHFDSNAVK